jgi:hypothetical protein
MNIDQLHEQIFSIMQDKGIYDGKIDYILQKDFDNKGHQYVCYISRKTEIEELYSIIIDTTGKIHSFDVANWDFNIDDFLFKDLENDYQILEMNADTHYGVWFQIAEMREEINFTDGLLKYLSYCKKNHIDIFNGTEAGKYFKGGTSNNTQFEIVSVGSGKNFWK